MEVKIRGLDQITATIGGVALSGFLFTGIWYIGKCSANKETNLDAERVAQAEKELQKLGEQSHQKAQAVHKDEHSQEQTPSLERLETKESWGYTGNLAPWYWGQLKEEWSACGQRKNQAPLDISGAREDEDLKALKFHYLHGTTQFTFHHQTVQGIVEPGSWLDWDGERFDLKKVYARTPSEHRVNSLPWEMELQLEHESMANQKIFISLLVTKGRTGSALSRIGSNLPRMKDEVREVDRLNWLELFPTKKTYWTYMGSETTPPCRTGVRWIVLRETIPVSTQIIDQFVILQKNNIRPVQDLSSRKILRSNR